MTFEVCAENVVGVMAAEAAGAHRVELCSALAEGGATPSLSLFRQPRACSQLPVHVLVCPRAGDLCYPDDELTVMLDDLELFKEAGADGLVFGTLNGDGTLNLPQVKELLAAADPLPVTFHRAFAVCREPLEVLERLALRSEDVPSLTELPAGCTFGPRRPFSSRDFATAMSRSRGTSQRPTSRRPRVFP